MAELPVMPLKTDALIADTTHMSAEEFGVYVRLLIAMWRHGARLPNDPRELARIGGVTIRRWYRIREKVLRPVHIAEGLITQKRLTSTWLEVHKIREKRAAAALKRWRKPNAHGHA